MNIDLVYSGANYLPSSSHSLTGWSDADWASDIDTQRSIRSYIFHLDSSCILSWRCQKQPVVVLSSIEAEYIAAATANKELLWLQTMIQELNFNLLQPSTLYCDNQSCIVLTLNPRFHDRSKHIDTRFHFLCEQITNKLLQLEYTPTAQM